MAAACVVPVLYLLFVSHYALNSFQDDDWSVVPIVHAALHGHLSFSLLWSQYYESRLLLGNVIDVVSGFADRLDLRALILFDAIVFVAAYGALLLLVRRYLGKRLTPVLVLVLGAIWFSLADWQNAFSAFQGSWYLTTLLFTAMLCALLVPGSRRTLWLALAIILALAASLSTIQGFLCWPVGAICILWPPRSRQPRPEIAIWSVAMVVTAAVYLHGFRFSQTSTCLAPVQCTTHYELHHVSTTLGFYFALIGNVVPGQTTGLVPRVHDPARFVLLGVVLFVTALWVLVQSWRRRGGSERMPVPGLLIVFSLLFDLTIAVGRGGTGVAGAVSHNRYVMANLILLTGIVVYGLARVPLARRSWAASNGGAKAYGPGLALAMLAVLLVVQVAVATPFGFTNARALRSAKTSEAQGYSILVAELEKQHFRQQLGAPNQRCKQLGEYLAVPVATLHDAFEDRLGEFDPATFHHYLSLPRPKKIAGC
jgi:hypothetical protein